MKKCKVRVGKLWLLCIKAWRCFLLAMVVVVIEVVVPPPEIVVVLAVVVVVVVLPPEVVPVPVMWLNKN